ELQAEPSRFWAAAVLWELAAAFFLVAYPATGFGVTYLSGVALKLEERLAFGVVLGPMLVAAATFLPSLAVRDVTVGTVLGGLAVALAAGAVGLLLDR